jgi:hypothetical protein
LLILRPVQTVVSVIGGARGRVHSRGAWRANRGGSLHSCISGEFSPVLVTLGTNNCRLRLARIGPSLAAPIAPGEGRGTPTVPTPGDRARPGGLPFFAQSVGGDCLRPGAGEPKSVLWRSARAERTPVVYGCALTVGGPPPVPVAIAGPGQRFVQWGSRINSAPDAVQRRLRWSRAVAQGTERPASEVHRLVW